MGTTMRFTGPVRCGDTVHIEYEIAEKKEIDSRTGRITFNLQVINQNGDVVETEIMNVMVVRKNSEQQRE
jgi:acyl dehydratase